jgi:hypothetical protein
MRGEYLKNKISTLVNAMAKQRDNLESRDLQRPQSRQDSPDYANNYSNDTPNNWLRGAGESAEQKPGFDHSGRKPWRGVP